MRESTVLGDEHIMSAQISQKGAQIKESKLAQCIHLMIKGLLDTHPSHDRTFLLNFDFIP